MKKEIIEKTMSEIEEDFEIILEKIEDEEFEEHDLEDLEQLLRSFKQEIWTYI